MHVFNCDPRVLKWKNLSNVSCVLFNRFVQMKNLHKYLSYSLIDCFLKMPYFLRFDLTSLPRKTLSL